MRTAILFDGPSSSGATPDLLIVETLVAVEEALRARGDEPLRVPVFPGADWIDTLTRLRPGLVFNLCEGIDGIPEAEPAVIGVLELLGLPYTGASPWTTALCLRKHIVNAAMHRAGLPIPPWALAVRGEPIPDVGYPAICKPASEDASVGVEQRSVVRDREGLELRVAQLHERWGEILIQQFIDGREMNVGLIGDRLLPISEIRFDDMPDDLWRIVTYQAKWETGSDEDLGTIPHCPAEVEPALAARLRVLASEAWRVVGGSGVCRVDFRVDARGPWILEVNANPDIAADAGLARMARAEGMDYSQLIGAVCDEAFSRPATAMGAWAQVRQLPRSGLAAPAAGAGSPR